MATTPDPTAAQIALAGGDSDLAAKIAIAQESPYTFPEGVSWTDKDCAQLYNDQEAAFSTMTLVQLITNVYNMDMGDPLIWVPGWIFVKYFLMFLNWPFAFAGLNAGRISMWTNGYIANDINMMRQLIPCVSQNMEKGAWNDWAAQQVFYVTSLAGINNLYTAANSFTVGFLSTAPIAGYGLGNLNGLLKLSADIAKLLVWSNMIDVPNTLAPVEWGFPGMITK